MNPKLPDPPDRPYQLFLSYAHENEAVKDRLKINLAPLKRTGWAEIWDDRAIPAGSDWREEIETAMFGADAAIFLLEEYFLASDFCMDVEIANFLQRHRDEGVLILFILTDHCLWEEFDYIRKFQLLPRDAKPVIEFDPPSLAYTAIAKEIKSALAQHQLKSRIAVAPQMLEDAASQMDFLLEADVPFAAHCDTGYPAPMPRAEETSLSALLARLPGATTHLFGRDAELALIDRWKNHKGVFLWVADGGTGKSALVRKWLETQGWPSETRFLGNSFYSQGSHNQATSARGFMLDALKKLNVAHEANAGDDELGSLLAEEAAKAPTVLVLDGIEPLQQLAKDDPKLHGMVKDRGLAALLEGLAKLPGQALCLASSRLPIPETFIADAPYFKEKHLALLPPDGARDLLRQRGVRGENAELDAMAKRCGFHPLALVLAAEFCHTFLQDRVDDFLLRAWQPKPGEKHAATVMDWFDSALAEEHQMLDRELARILGLFDRPAPWGVLRALKAAAPIPGLTVALHIADEPAVLESLARLSQWGLLNADLTRNEPDLDAHPLVREHFGALLERDEPESWQAAHSVLFDWFCSLPEKEQPDTLEELEPLYRAISHGCKAGHYRTARQVIFQDRIQRRDQRYSQFQLGAYSADLTVLAGFFPLGWSQMPVTADARLPGEALSETARFWLLAEAAFCLMALGRLEEALELRRTVMQERKQSQDWNNFCISSLNLVDLLTSLGRWAEAESVSREAVSAAARIGDKERWHRTDLVIVQVGFALHGQGRLAEALATYVQAEKVQAQNEPESPMLYGPQGYNYAQLLLERAGHAEGWQEVFARGLYSLKLSIKWKQLLSQALEHCTLGLVCAAIGEAEAGPAFDRAVTTMRRAGSIHDQPAMHLARAQYQRNFPDLPAAWADHDAAHAIALRGNMRTYLAECALLAGNLCLDQGRVSEAAAQYTTAAQLIREDGYGRRYTELHLLHARLFHAQHDPAAVLALAEAEARIREVGQWYFWRELRTVAKEIGAPDPGECPDQKISVA